MMSSLEEITFKNDSQTGNFSLPAFIGRLHLPLPRKKGEGPVRISLSLPVRVNSLTHINRVLFFIFLKLNNVILSV